MYHQHDASHPARQDTPSDTPTCVCQPHQPLCHACKVQLAAATAVAIAHRRDQAVDQYRHGQIAACDVCADTGHVDTPPDHDTPVDTHRAAPVDFGPGDTRWPCPACVDLTPAAPIAADPEAWPDHVLDWVFAAHFDELGNHVSEVRLQRGLMWAERHCGWRWPFQDPGNGRPSPQMWTEPPHPDTTDAWLGVAA